MLFDFFCALGAGCTELGVVVDLVNQCIRIEKVRRANRNLPEGQFDFRMVMGIAVPALGQQLQ
jgi:hypothetical protein